MYSTKMQFLVVFISLNFLYLTCAQNDSPVVETKKGRVQGTTWRTRKDVSFYAFLGIPYAQAPVGELRFKNPQRLDPWEGIRNATEWGPICVQTSNEDTADLPMSEDCLHLNIFTKSIEVRDLKPVIIYIHGGSFERGAARHHQPHYLMDRDVVLVTINFRFGALGLLATGTSDAPGNVGFKDQVMALQFVKINIKNFGGDPNRITLAGLSSGGFAATAHMASEWSNDIGFHRVIAMSGTVGSFPALKENTLPLANSLAAQLSCPTANISEMVKCLRTKNASDIVNTDVRNAVTCQVGATWQAVIETDPNLKKRFLTQDPLKFLGKGSNQKYQVMTGFTQNELYHHVSVFLNLMISNPWFANFNSYSASCFNFEKYSATSTIFKSLYLPSKTPFSLNYQTGVQLGNLLSDGFINYGTNRLAKILSSASHDVYYYKFSYFGQYGLYYDRTFPLVLHSDDLQFVFPTKFIGPEIKLTDKDNFMVERMTKIWENFAKTGNPNNPSDPELNNVWSKYTPQSEKYLDIGATLDKNTNVFQSRFNAMDDLLGP